MRASAKESRAEAGAGANEPTGPTPASLLLPTPQAGRARQGCPTATKGGVASSATSLRTLRCRSAPAAETSGDTNEGLLGTPHSGSQKDARRPTLLREQRCPPWLSAASLPLGPGMGAELQSQSQSQPLEGKGGKGSREGWKPGVQQAKARKTRCLGSKAAA